MKGRTRIFDADETARVLPYAKLADEIRSVALRHGAGDLVAPNRLALPIPETSGVLLVMPVADEDLTVTKLVTVHPENAGSGLPTIQGEVIVADSTTGEKLASLHGATVTARRTAALSLLAVRDLAEKPDGTLLILGAGTQGLSHLEAFRDVLGTEEVRIVSRTHESALRLAERAEELGVNVTVAEGVREGAQGADLIVTATTSRKPVLDEAAGAFVCAVGSFEPQSRELAADVVAGSTVIVDTLEGAKEEAGDLIQAVASGEFEWKRAMTLSEALEREERIGGDVVFESVGSALWDLAAARVALS